MKFEWQQTKADANLINHGVTFDLAQSVFSDAFAIGWEDDRADHGEVRHITVGLAADGTVLGVALRGLHGTTGSDSNHFSPEGHST